MATYATYAFPDTFSGDTLDAVNFTAARTPTAFANLANVEIEFRPSSTNNCGVSLELTVANSGVTITNAATWAFTVKEIEELDLEPGYYVCSFRFTDVNGRVKIYLRGNITILQPETRD